MKENRSVKSLESDINIFELIRAELSNLHWILLIVIVFSGAMFLYSTQKIKPQYMGEKSISVKTQIKDPTVFSEIISSDEFLGQVITTLNLNSSVEQLRSKVTVSPLLSSSELDTIYFKVQVGWTDLTTTTKISDLIATHFIQKAPALLPIIEPFVLGSKVDMILSPSKAILQRTIIGGILGGIIAVGFILISYLFDFRIRSTNELVEFSKIQVVAAVKVKK